MADSVLKLDVKVEPENGIITAETKSLIIKANIRNQSDTDRYLFLRPIMTLSLIFLNDKGERIETLGGADMPLPTGNRDFVKVPANSNYEFQWKYELNRRGEKTSITVVDDLAGGFSGALLMDGSYKTRVKIVSGNNCFLRRQNKSVKLTISQVEECTLLSEPFSLIFGDKNPHR